MEKCIIAAVSDNWAIGRGGSMPWHISADLKYFKQTTMGCPVIMGRRTFESIGRPLPGRLNIVVSRSMPAPGGCLVAPSLDIALVLATADINQSEKCFIMGGGQVYSQAMELADRLYITHIHAVVSDADTFFPAVDPQVWQVESSSEPATDEASGLEYQFVVYTRR